MLTKLRGILSDSMNYWGKIPFSLMILAIGIICISIATEIKQLA